MIALSSGAAVKGSPLSGGYAGAKSTIRWLTSYAAVVVGPSHDSATVRSVQVVGLAPRVALLVVVLSDGAVEKRTIELESEVSDEVLGDYAGW